jgi:hypothetical protein
LDELLRSGERWKNDAFGEGMSSVFGKWLTCLVMVEFNEVSHIYGPFGKRDSRLESRTLTHGSGSRKWEPVRVCAASQPWTATGGRSGLLTQDSDDEKRFVARADEKLTVFLELERVTRDSLRFLNPE